MSSRPVGALCVRCNYRPALPHKQSPTLATMYCGDRCRRQAATERYRQLMRRDANAIRRLANIKSVDAGPMFTAPELATLRRVLERLTNGYGGTFMHPPHRQPDGRLLRRGRQLEWQGDR